MIYYLKRSERKSRNAIVYYAKYPSIIETIESSYQIRFNGSLVYALSTYLFQRRCIDWFPEKNLQQSLTNF